MLIWSPKGSCKNPHFALHFGSFGLPPEREALVALSGLEDRLPLVRADLLWNIRHIFWTHCAQNLHVHKGDFPR